MVNKDDYTIYLRFILIFLIFYHLLMNKVVYWHDAACLWRSVLWRSRSV